MDKLNNTKWLETIYYLLKATKKIVRTLTSLNKNVVVHCSDGWDRTAMLCSLTQILIDPFCRTLKGLEVIIEKEWVSFGFQFDKRLSNYADANKYGQDVSPIFVQFLDCIYQLICQFPTAFQYNKHLLKFLATQVYTCKFGTFLFDHEWGRKKFEEATELKLTETVSIWTYVNDNCGQYLNPLYSKESDILSPHIHQSDLRFWREYFLSWHEHSSPHSGMKMSDPEGDVSVKYLDQYFEHRKRVDFDKTKYKELNNKYDEILNLKKKNKEEDAQTEVN